MGTDLVPTKHRSIFSPAAAGERRRNFDDYWAYTLGRDGQILEGQKDLTRKRERLEGFQQHPVRSRHPLREPARFYRNYVKMQDSPETLDQKTRLLTFLYKFARHEWIGISVAWDATPTMAESKRTISKISRYHLSEEFCHVRLFQEMFRTFHLHKVEWAPPTRWMVRLYRLFARLPGAIMSPPAFVSELMGLTVYLHIDKALDEILGDEPEVRDRVRELLREIMVDELAHVGQRRNFMGPIGLRMAQWLVEPMYRMFFRDIPETTSLFDLEQMIRDGLNFNYSTIPPEILRASWVPSYCVQADPRHRADVTAF